MIGFVAPHRHSLLWRFGPEGYRRLMGGLAGHPALVRLLAEVGGGLWLASRQYAGEEE